MTVTAAACSQHLCLYNTAEFSSLNVDSSKGSYFRVDYAERDQLVGSLCGVSTGGEFTSGFSAPFGGPDFVRDHVELDDVSKLISHAATELRQRGHDRLRVKARPPYSTRAGSFVHFALFNCGFTVEACELNHHIDLSSMTGIGSYVAMLKPPARRALKHAEAEPFAFDAAESDADWEAGYNLLASNRAKKGRSLKLGLDYLRRAAVVMPGRVRMWVLTHAGTPCAAAVVYRTEARAQQVVYWGDANHELSRSPMNTLALRVVERALADKMATLDLGTSSLDGQADRGLVQFKQSILGRPGLRLDFVKKL